jgi:molybdopterin synthase catalytic subunit
MPGTLPTDDLFLLTREPIDHAVLVAHVRAAEDGAAYESMALAKIREISAAIHEKFAIHRVAIAHRLGRLQIGETSVFIAVSAPHRRAAFDACRFAIDTLKRTVPIWKKEYFEDGAVWADGELPPAPPDTQIAKPAS